MKIVQISLILSCLIGAAKSFGDGPTAPGMGTGSGSGSPTTNTSGLLKLPCGTPFPDCNLSLELVKNKILSNGKKTVELLVVEAKIPAVINGSPTKKPFPKSDSEHVCPLTGFEISYKEIIKSSSDKSLEALGPEIKFGPGKEVNSSDFVSKCSDETLANIKLAMFDGPVGAGVAGGAPIAYTKIAKEVADKVKIIANEVVYQLSTIKCNVPAISNIFNQHIGTLNNLKNKTEAKANCGKDANLTDDERNLCSSKHAVLAAWTALNSGMAQAATCDMHENAMSKYRSYAAVFSTTYRRDTLKACSLATARLPASTKPIKFRECFAESMHKRIKEEQDKI